MEKAAAHAVANAVLAAMQGEDALAGAAGALAGELAAKAIMESMYPGKKAGDLDETQMQTISALATLAAGIAGGVAAGAIAGAQAGKTVVENNSLAIPITPPPVAGNNTGDAVNDANKTMASALDKQLKEIKNTLDKATQCSFGRACSADDAEQTEGPNAGKNLTDTEKAEFGGAGSGTPGGWEPQDEENARNSQKQDITVEDLTSTSSKGKETTGRSKLFERTGGSNAANKEFDALSPTEIKEIPGGRVGKLPDGRTVIVRERSTDGRPTLEIQSGKNRIKFRYDE
ncbi:hypothetical protein D0U00_21245 [Leclercia adecarboxylata]|uniref:VENN motif pre-toxin domain-containing protein n=1 Tax=Leclercia adecarboxylata TaxID=83655 RepID=UPI000E3BE544|nr:VENN motif pre-toxin domain-containing protein [Leclercia adecarboxylata]RFS76818.1 hypothetical protein D0U00_21245 [Leclercia adecarboxylata]